MTDAAITTAAVFCGLKVMVVGGPNDSVEEAMEKLLSMKTAARPIRFRSAFLQPLSSDDESDSKIRDASAENDIQSVDNTITMAEIAEKFTTQHNLKHAEYGFNVQRQLFIDQQVKAHRVDDNSFVSKAACELIKPITIGLPPPRNRLISESSPDWLSISRLYSPRSTRIF
jgi:hypothetical protein